MKKDDKKQKWQPVGEKFKGAKIAKTFRIDMDVFVWLRQEAERTGIPYQTLLNAKLRQSMNTDQEKVITEDQVRAIVREEIKKEAS
ncbi:MAG: hypothetical protein AB7F43_12425 [Bacteriovoracia bacterium]